MTGLFLGVDGGQSSTTALIGDETGRVLGMGCGGPCNHAGAEEGRERFVSALSGSVGAALDQAAMLQAGMKQVTFEAACLGFSGGFADKEPLARKIVSARNYLFTHDALIALAGATGGEPGVITIAGTGSMAFGRNSEGRTARAGGWGYVFGDEGGAFDIARQALRAALHSEEGWGPQTALRAAFMESAGASDANDLLHRFYTDEYPRARVASFAKLVDDTARSGDQVARDILNGAAQTLATLASAVIRQLFPSPEAARVSYIGGAFQSAMLLERYRMLMELDERYRVTAPLYGPAAGALIEAYRLAGVKCELKNV